MSNAKDKSRAIENGQFYTVEFILTLLVEDLVFISNNTIDIVLSGPKAYSYDELITYATNRILDTYDLEYDYFVTIINIC